MTPIRSRVDSGHVRYFFVDVEESDGWRTAWEFNFLVDKHSGIFQGYIGATKADGPKSLMPTNWTIGF